MGKSWPFKNGDKAGSSKSKKKKERNRVYVPRRLAQVLYENKFVGVGRRPSHRQMAPQREEVPVPPVPREGRAQCKDIAFALNSDMWDEFRVVEWDTWRCVGFLGDDEFDYGWHRELDTVKGEDSRQLLRTRHCLRSRWKSKMKRSRGPLFAYQSWGLSEEGLKLAMEESELEEMAGKRASPFN
jgi:hypothetical protein